MQILWKAPTSAHQHKSYNCLTDSVTAQSSIYVFAAGLDQSVQVLLQKTVSLLTAHTS
jgi:hypothetical protein